MTDLESRFGGRVQSVGRRYWRIGLAVFGEDLSAAAVDPFLAFAFGPGPRM